MSHFSDIGFYPKNEDELYALAEQVYARCEAYPCEKGTYYAYRDPSGAELWLQVNTQKELIGVNPHFAGNSMIRGAVTAEIARETSVLDAAIHVWAGPQNASHPESGHYPIVLDTPGYHVQALPHFPAMKTLQIAAFAEELSFFEDEDAYYASQRKGDFPMAAKSFIPAGMFGEADNEHSTAEALASFSGKIILAEARTNTFTQKLFHYFQVETFGGTYDVVADAQEWPELPPVGGIVKGDFWLSGRWVNPLKQKEAPLFPKKRLRKVITSLLSKLT
jgi:hypothetical protein